MAIRDTAGTDRDLIAAARAGDARALDALVTRYEPRVYRFSLRLTGNADDAADVAQDTLMAMARSIATFRGEAALSTWLYTIARRFSIRKRRRSTYAPAREESLDAMDPKRVEALPAAMRTPEQIVAGRETQDAVNRALATLPTAQRDVLVLRDIEGLTAPEVGKVLGLGVRAVKSRLHRARLALRGALAPLVETPKPGCRDVVAMFSKHLEGDLGVRTCAEMERHLAGCSRCRGACASLKRVLAICRRTPATRLPPALRKSIHAAIAQMESGA